jgi:hypothetical protein
MSTKIHPKCPREFTQKMSTKIHPKRGLLVDKSVHEMSPKVSTRCHPFCPREVTYYVHEMSATHQSDIINRQKIRTIKLRSLLNYNYAGFDRGSVCHPFVLFITALPVWCIHKSRFIFLHRILCAIDYKLQFSSLKSVLCTLVGVEEIIVWWSLRAV